MPRPWSIVLASVVAVAGTALAAGGGSASYEVRYQQVADDCNGQGMTLEQGEVSVRQGAADDIEVALAGVGTLKGTRSANGRFKAQGVGSPRGDLTAHLSASGRAGDAIQMIFIAEFYRGKKPLCTQSWSGQGRRK